MADSAAELAAIAKSKDSEERNPPPELSVDSVTTSSHQKLPEESELFTETRREAPVEPSVDSIQKTPEELVAKAIAPIKREFLRPPPSRTANESVADSDATQCRSGLVKEKKSKRQLKRERQQERNSASNLCPEIAKTGDARACRYGDKCHSSHDIEAFKAQKPDDLDGECPFTVAKAPCPYGFSCRFFGTHKDGNAATSGNALNKITELNGLSKDVQKALWKKKVKFTKADAVLKSLGLMAVKFKPKAEIAEEEKCTLDNQVSGDNKSVKVDNDLIVKSERPSQDLVEDNIDEMCPANDLRPKAEIADEEKCTVDNLQVSDENNSVKVDNGLIVKSESPLEDLVEDNIDEMCPANDLRPFKKAKSSDDVRNSYGELKNGGLAADEENSCSDLENGKAELEKYMDRSGAKSEPISTLDDMVTKPEGSLKIHPRERKLIDFSGKLYLAPLTTVGNLPFRRICKSLGADVTCGEMAMCTNLLQGQASEWALLRRHQCEDLFGVQICGAYPDTIARTVELIERECTVDFIDINMGCPIDIVVNKGAGSSLLTKPMRMKNIVEAASATVEKPITIKVRTGYFEGKPRIDSLIKDIGNWGASAVTVHGRSRQQRYSKLADWDYVYQCARKAPDMLQVLGNGDVFSYSDWTKHIVDCPKLSSCMIARGGLIKPWIFTEIKEQRDWDISSEERLNILKDYARYGLQHWGSDTKGVETTRHFLLEWLSYTCRYIPVGLLDVIPQRLNWRPPSYYGRNDLETLMASDSAADWIRISEMLLGKVPAGFTFAPKHKSNAYDRAENG